MIHARTSAIALGLTAWLASQALAQFALDNGYVSGLLELPRYQHELQLATDQMDRARAASRMVIERFAASSRDLRDLPASERAAASMARFREIADAYEEEISAFLKPEQLKRLREISLRHRGGEAFNARAVQDALKLTAEQRAKIDKNLRRSREERMEVMKLPRDPANRRAIQERTEAMLRDLEESQLAVLDDDQKKAWAEMLGEPLSDAPRVTSNQRARIGQPFTLSFTDAIGGSKVSMDDLRGKVVVIDFWATWCAPCVAEMPRMKALYAKYRDRGVEFIGISLDASEDKGGLDKLKAFVEANEIEWPQYYQGKGWEGEFSRAWEVNSIPRVFVVDRQGRLAEADAAGRLETLIPELLADRGQSDPSGD